jgi:hypothetical protein
MNSHHAVGRLLGHVAVWVCMLAWASSLIAADLSIAHTVLWNKLDSTSSTANSLVGFAFRKVGNPVFRVGVSGNAIGALNDESRLEMSANAFFGRDQSDGTVSLFLKKGMVASVPYRTPMPSIFGAHAYGPSSYHELSAGWTDGLSGPSGINFQIIDRNSVPHQAIDAAFNTSAVPVGKWVHMMFVWDLQGIQGSSDRLRIYRDGKLVGRYSQRVPSIRASTAPVTLAGGHATDRLPGKVALLIDEIMVFEEAIVP